MVAHKTKFSISILNYKLMLVVVATAFSEAAIIKNKGYANSGAGECLDNKSAAWMASNT